MADKNSISEFEKKIKKLQSKKRAKLIVKIVSACLVFSLIAVYFITPISKVENSKIIGNVNFTDEEILQIADIKKNDSLYLISKSKIENNLKKSLLIDSDTIKVNITPMGLNISFEEIVPLFRFDEDIYMSDGKIISEEIKTSKDPLISNYLYKFANHKDMICLYSKPFEEKFTNTRLIHLSDLILSLELEDKELIEGISYDSENYYFEIYYQVNNSDTLLKVVTDSVKSVDILNTIFKKKMIEFYKEYLDTKSDEFVEFDEEINGETKKVKSIKIIPYFDVDENTWKYVAKSNNPVINDVEEGENNE